MRVPESAQNARREADARALLEGVYPSSPNQVPPDLTKAPESYKRQVWLAVTGLGLFLTLYVFLSGWFVWTSIRLFRSIGSGGDDGIILGILLGSAAALLGIFMLKGLFFIKAGGPDKAVEVKAADEPRLFAFLNQLADEVGAPRPHRVFLVPEVNAAVFYDLSPLNLIFPSKKNLLIGIGLVNNLNLGEFKAVLAHEFGHFAQRSMAVGRWVYLSQQIAGQIIARRDILDRFLQGLSHFDLRVAWIGWLLSLVVWSIRSLMETLFQVVILAQRALSREMEFQADLVAVSLSGSDAPIHALHRIQAADQAWDRSLNFVNSEYAKGHKIADLFAVQSRVLGHLRTTMSDPDFGLSPQIPSHDPAKFRVFKPDLAQPPRMWATHPFNHEREENAKRRYLPAPIDSRDAWLLFSDRIAVCNQVSAKLYDGIPGKASLVPMEETLAAVDLDFAKESLNPAYRGVYLQRSVVITATRVEELYGDIGAAGFGDLYPASLSDELAEWRQLSQEKEHLQALKDGRGDAPDGVIRHRGRALKSSELGSVIAAVGEELDDVNATLLVHDRLCRSLHLAAARRRGQGWDEHLKSLLALLHYSEHAAADIADAQNQFGNTLHVTLAGGNPGSGGIAKILASANVLHQATMKVYRVASEMQLNDELSRGLGQPWSDKLGKYEMPVPVQENINEWLRASDGWTRVTLRKLGELRDLALNHLLQEEARVASAGQLAAAPAPVQVPASYAVLPPGKERPLAKLSLWARFRTADGVFPSLARLAIAGTIVAGVLGLGNAAGEAKIHVYNGLNLAVTVKIEGQQIRLGPYGHEVVSVRPDRDFLLETRSASGELIESCRSGLCVCFSNNVYNIARAAPMMERTALYGNAQVVPPRLLGTPRWFSTRAQHIFENPPDSVKIKGGGATRLCLSCLGQGSVPLSCGIAKASGDEAGLAAMILAHVRWDDARQQAPLLEWLEVAQKLPAYAETVRQRLAAEPLNLLLLRAQQDLTPPGDLSVLKAQQQLAATHPDNPDLQYLVIRSMADPQARAAAVFAAQAKWPEHLWLAFVAASSYEEKEDWAHTQSCLEIAARPGSPVADHALLDLVRLRRLTHPDASLKDLGARSGDVKAMLEMETGDAKIADTPLFAYTLLRQGKLAEALAKSKSSPQMRLLVGASDGARPEDLMAALKLMPEESGLDWLLYALRFRQGSSSAPVLKYLQTQARSKNVHWIQVLDSIRPDADVAELDRKFKNLSLDNRGKACVCGILILGDKALPAWRQEAKSLLFANEMPYLK